MCAKHSKNNSKRRIFQNLRRNPRRTVRNDKSFQANFGKENRDYSKDNVDEPNDLLKKVSQNFVNVCQLVNEGVLEFSGSESSVQSPQNDIEKLDSLSPPPSPSFEDESASSIGDRPDFLTMPPDPNADEPEDYEDSYENGSNQNGTVSSESDRPQRRTQIPNRGSGRKQTRKQTKPKKRVDRVNKAILKLQSTTKLCIPKLPFQRLVRQILQKYKNDFRMQSATLMCLQEASEAYLVTLFEDSYLCSLHRARQTVTNKDMQLVQILRGPNEPERRQSASH